MLNWLLRFLILATLILMAMGTLVRTMKAGLACPDWPLCFGQLIPDFHPAVWAEFLHRAVAGGISLVFLWACILAWQTRSRPLRVTAVIAALVLLIQILYGALTVLWLVNAYVVATHLTLATVFVGLLFWMERLTSNQQPLQVNSSLRPLKVLSIGLFLLIGGQIFLGGLVASTYAGMVCVDWPLCNGQWIPTWQGPIGLQIVHRFWAYGLILLLTVTWLVSFTNVSLSPFRPLFFLFFIGIILQTTLGVFNLIFFIPPWLTVLHQQGAILLILISLALIYQVFHARPSTTEK